MRSLRTKLASMVALALLMSLPVGTLAAQDLQTGPPKGTALTPVRCYANSGPYSGQEFDAAKQIGSGNGALLFIHQLTRNGLPTVNALDDFAAQYGLLDFKSFTLLLTSDRTRAENRLLAANGSLKLRNPIVVCLDGPEGPGNLALNRKCVQSLLLIRQGKVVKSIALTDIADEDREQVRQWVEEVTGPLPSEPADYKRLVEEKLPSDPEALKHFVRDQSIELHRVHRELQAATRGIPKYRTPGRPGMQPNRMGGREKKSNSAPKPKSQK